MHQKILTNVLEFLFPAKGNIRKIENTSSEDLLRLLPTSESTTDTTTLFTYADERVKHLVWEIKYYRNEKITSIVGKLLAQKIEEKVKRAEKTEAYYLVPIPLTAKRLRERGYNHTELLAKAILKYMPENFELAALFLKKIRHTPKQHSIENREDRFINIAGAFEVPVPQRGAVKDAHILIIDDVVTTGATVSEAKCVLLSAGAKSVHIFAIAH